MLSLSNLWAQISSYWSHENNWKQGPAGSSRRKMRSCARWSIDGKTSERQMSKKSFRTSNKTFSTLFPPIRHIVSWFLFQIFYCLNNFLPINTPCTTYTIFVVHHVERKISHYPLVIWFAKCRKNAAEIWTVSVFNKTTINSNCSLVH